MAQFGFTAFPSEDVSRLIEPSNADLYLFSSDYPHAECGRNPLGRFEESFAAQDEAACTAFWSGSFERVFAGFSTEPPDSEAQYEGESSGLAIPKRPPAGFALGARLTPNRAARKPCFW
jgi:hypothetical protein